MRFSTIDILQTTQNCQARLLIVSFMEWATPFNKKKES
jgi:hypothetical protein